MSIKKIQHVPTSETYHVVTLAMMLRHNMIPLDENELHELNRRIDVTSRFTGEPRETIWKWYLNQCSAN